LVEYWPLQQFQVTSFTMRYVVRHD